MTPHTHGIRFGLRRWAALLAVAVVVPLVVALPTTSARAGTADFDCLGANGLGYTQGNTPANLMAGRMSVPGFSVTTIGTGDINFVGLNSGKHPTWQLWFNSLKWLEPLVQSYEQGLNGGTTHLNRAMAIAQDWTRTYPETTPGQQPAWNDQATSLRSQTLACLAKYRSDAWLMTALDTHARHLANSRNYAGDWNHGLEQNIALLAIGCIRDNSSWMTTAENRAHDTLVRSIDSQGAFNEQSPGYGSWTISRWWTVERVLAGCNRQPLPDLGNRLAKFATFLANATQPDGTLVQIGDTYAEPIRSDVTARYADARYAATRGRSGVSPQSKLSIYNAGFVLSRSGWGQERAFESESLFTMRYGPMRYAHGHFDHGSVTWYARGRKLLVDSGHVGFENSAYRTWIKSPEAHNTFTVPGVPLRTYGVSTLTRYSNGSKGQFYEMNDSAGASGGAYQGLVRSRGVYMLPENQAMVAFDRTNSSKLRWMYASKGKLKTKYWHLDPSFKVTRVTDSLVTAVAGATQMNVIHLPFPGERLGKGSQRAVRGATRPHQGWVSTAQGRKVTAATISQSTSSWRSVSVIIPGAVGQRVNARIVKSGTGYRVDIWKGSTYSIVRIASDGRMYR